MNINESIRIENIDICTNIERITEKAIMIKVNVGDFCPRYSNVWIPKSLIFIESEYTDKFIVGTKDGQDIIEEHKGYKISIPDWFIKQNLQ